MIKDRNGISNLKKESALVWILSLIIRMESAKLAPLSWIVSTVLEKIIAHFVKIKKISTPHQLMAFVSVKSHFGSVIKNA